MALGSVCFPALFTAQYANVLAKCLFDPLQRLIRPAQELVNARPVLPAAVFGGDYGLMSMLPFLLLYSVLTVLLFAVLMALLKASGLVDRMTTALHPLLLPFGLTGRDLVWVMMGFGCNVPAVIHTRSCPITTRANCVTAIGIGAACSYQLPATVAILAAGGRPQLITPYMVLLVAVTMALLALSASRLSRDPRNPLLIERRAFLQRQTLSAVFRETLLGICHFFFLALPVFFALSAAARLLAWSGALVALTRLLGSAMAVLNLPRQAATAVILGSIRKDGLTIGLLDMETKSLKVALDEPVQRWSAVLRAGIFLPCLVTVLSIARELEWSFALRLMLRQAAAPAAFCMLVARASPRPSFRQPQTGRLDADAPMINRLSNSLVGGSARSRRPPLRMGRCFPALQRTISLPVRAGPRPRHKNRFPADETGVKAGHQGGRGDGHRAPPRTGGRSATRPDPGTRPDPLLAGADASASAFTVVIPFGRSLGLFHRACPRRVQGEAQAEQPAGSARGRRGVRRPCARPPP